MLERLTLALLLILAPPCHAAELPVLDSGEYCQTTFARMPVGPDRDMNVSACIESEAHDKALLKSGWPKVPAKDQAACMGVSGVLSGSYESLYDCAATAIGVACLNGSMQCN
jgi:hypothetical protein